MSTRVWHRMVIAVLSLGFASLPVKAQSVGPLANTTVGNARLIVPDGSSLRQSIGAGETRWFVFGAEPGKTYVVEAVDPDSDLVSNTIGALHVYAANGTTTPPAETNVDCTASTRAPAMELPVAVSGMRCVVRTFPPSTGNTQNKRGLYVAVGSVSGPSFDIRVRESTIYGRWTTNGYDFHVELENTTADSMCAEVIFLPNTGDSYAGTWSGGLTTLQLTIPPFGANKTVFANGTLVGPDFRGTLRIGACPSPTNFVPSGLHVSTYAYNPVTDKFLYFFTNPANNGATANSWSAAGGSGTVTSIATGPGLAGGPITTTGTINLAATNLLPTVACAANQVPKWNGSAWTCAADNNSGGTVTSVGTGAGLTGGPIAASGTINLAGTQLLPTVACAANQIPKWNGSAWACAPDNGTNAFVQGGNAFGATAVLGTTDTQPLELRVADARGLRIEPPGDLFNATPNIVGGSPANSAAAGISGATIAGGGWSGASCGSGFSSCANSVMFDFGTVSGGRGNTAGKDSIVAGGYSNTASNFTSTVGGGADNVASGSSSTVAGGANNNASGDFSIAAGGSDNTASGRLSFAAGNEAIASAQGMFAWADSQPFFFDFATYRYPQSSVDTFNVRATGGVVFVTGINGSNGLPTWECYTYNGGGWTCASDRNLKRNLTQLDGSEVLSRLVAMPIYQWQPKDGPNAQLKHVGPMAQDFYAAFGLGDSEKAIGMQDAEGVALAAIQGLNARVEEQQREISELREHVSAAESLRGELAALRAELADLRETRNQMTTHPSSAADRLRADASH